MAFSASSPALSSSSSFRAARTGADDVIEGGSASARSPQLLYAPDEKYPPRPSDQHVPLLDDDGAGRRSPFRDRVPPASFLATRTRLHPLTLLPAFVFGLLLAMSGIFGTSTFWRAPTDFRLNSYSIGPGNDNKLRVPTSRPHYTFHSSGHIFLHPSSLDPSAPSSSLTPSEAASAPVGIRHPIHDLIANGTRTWNEKLARQSQTLEAAVLEYKRRYRRSPPKGFDKWFAFAQKSNVVLIDEFDGILRDIHPFYALSPQLLSQRSLRLQTDPSTFTMRVKGGEVEVIGEHREDGRADDQRDLMKRWKQWLPDVNISMSAHDGPSIMMDYTTKQKHTDAADAGTLLSEQEANEIDEDASLWGFPLSCPPNSRLRRAYDGLELSTLPPGPSYVHNHLKTMDLCENPEWQYLHGFTSWPGMRPQNLTPIFSFAKTPLHSDILLTPLEQYWDKEPWDPVWEKKPNNKAIWRGSTTGVWFDRGTWWRSSQRVRLFFMSQDKTGSQLVRFDGVGQESPMGVESISERNVSTSTLVERYLDFAFSGKASQCTEEDGSCDAVRRVIQFAPTIGWNQANEFKYLLDLDGNAWSGRFHRLLSSNSAILKSTIFPEWYSGWIQPWVHYIPIKVDYTDLFDVMAFFSGDLDGRNGHEELAKGIAEQGKEYATKHWRYEDMEAYFFRLALEWARCTSSDRASMDYVGPGA